jgi:hypothetical protein
MSLTLEEVTYRLLPRVQPGRALADNEWWTLVSVAEVLKIGSPVQIDPEQIADNIETFLINGRSRKTWRVRVLLALIGCVTLATHGRPFCDLSITERRDLVNTRFAEGKHVWGLCMKVRHLVTLGIYGDPNAVPATGYIPILERRRFRKQNGRVVQLRVERQARQEVSLA